MADETPGVTVDASPAPTVTTTTVVAPASPAPTLFPEGLLEDAVYDIEQHPDYLLRGVAAAAAYFAAILAALIFAASNGNVIDQHYLEMIFSANPVWLVVAGVLGVGTYLVKN